jgi:hypothetical protein
MLPDRITRCRRRLADLPRRHSVALYYVINVSSIVLRRAFRRDSDHRIEPSVCFEDDDVLAKMITPCPPR